MGCIASWGSSVLSGLSLPKPAWPLIYYVNQMHIYVKTDQMPLLLCIII